jgi:NAD-dependent DNA ligase
MLADGIVVDIEIAFLHQWVETHPDALARWSVRTVYDRIHRHLADGVIDEDERLELQNLLLALVGGTITLQTHEDGATTLPVDTPAAKIVWNDSVYVFAGRFAYGTRADCEREVFRRGGSCEPNVTPRTSFLVIGTFGSRDRARTAYGRKIDRATELRASGSGLRIVHEDHWARHLVRAMSASAAGTQKMAIAQ